MAAQDDANKFLAKVQRDHSGWEKAETLIDKLEKLLQDEFGKDVGFITVFWTNKGIGYSVNQGEEISKLALEYLLERWGK
jgi:uncharacterized protein YoxC